VGVDQRVAERDADLQDLLVGERILCHQARERLAFHQLGGEVEAAVLLRGLIQSDDRRVGEPRGRVGLARGALADAVRRAGDALDGDLAAQQLVVGAEDLAEAA
jgi:hypothetical protein